MSGIRKRKPLLSPLLSNKQHMFPRKPQRDRWLLSYADFITLLFATFVLMYATARAKEHQAAPVIPAVKQVAAARAVQAGPPALPPPFYSNLLRNLKTRLELEQQKGLLTITTEPRGVVISLDDKTCFNPGQAEVQTATIPMFSKVGNVLAQYKNRILLEGHTDSAPIHNNRFRSNWELSTARSIAVMELMQKQAGLPPEQFLIGGSADNAPLSNNETEQGRAQNRRVDIVVLDTPQSTDASAASHPVSFATTAKN